MPQYPTAPRPEPIAATGELLLSPSHIALLQGLLDRPDCTAPSYKDWEISALPHLRRFTSRVTIYHARRGRKTMHSAWIIRDKVGSRVQVTLSERGRAILDLQVPVVIRRWGRYVGLRGIRVR